MKKYLLFDLDGTRVKKEDVVAETLRQLFQGGPIIKEKARMIGDRKFDVEGARAFQIESVGVTYGYGSRGELEAAHADHIVSSDGELLRLLLEKNA